MYRLNSVRATRVVVCLATLGLSLQASGALASGVPSARPNVPSSQVASAARSMKGTVQSVTKHSLTLTQAGSKKVTQVYLSAKTRYVVKGKHLTKAPAFARGSSISVIMSESKGVFTAVSVIVGLSATSTAGTVTTSPPALPTVVPPGILSLAGAVTLASAASVTLKTSTGTETIKLTAATRYFVEGKAMSSLPVLHAGEKVKIAAVQSRGVLVGRTFTVT